MRLVKNTKNKTKTIFAKSNWPRQAQTENLLWLQSVAEHIYIIHDQKYTKDQQTWMNSAYRLLGVVHTLRCGVVRCRAAPNATCRNNAATFCNVPHHAVYVYKTKQRWAPRGTAWHRNAPQRNEYDVNEHQGLTYWSLWLPSFCSHSSINPRSQQEQISVIINVFFLMILHSSSDSIVQIVEEILDSNITLPATLHQCTLRRNLLFWNSVFGSVFTDYVALYGDYYYKPASPALQAVLYVNYC